MPVHDAAFKQLLRALFREFLQAFVPDLYKDLDPKRIEFLDKELFQAFEGKFKLKVVDLAVRVKLRGQEGFVLVHVENQAEREAAMDQRMFLYAAWLIASYGLPVYPILLT